MTNPDLKYHIFTIPEQNKLKVLKKVISEGGHGLIVFLDANVTKYSENRQALLDLQSILGVFPFNNENNNSVIHKIILNKIDLAENERISKDEAAQLLVATKIIEDIAVAKSQIIELSCLHAIRDLADSKNSGKWDIKNRPQSVQRALEPIAMIIGEDLDRKSDKQQATHNDYETNKFLDNPESVDGDSNSGIKIAIFGPALSGKTTFLALFHAVKKGEEPDAVYQFLKLENKATQRTIGFDHAAFGLGGAKTTQSDTNQIAQADDFIFDILHKKEATSETKSLSHQQKNSEKRQIIVDYFSRMNLLKVYSCDIVISNKILNLGKKQTDFITGEKREQISDEITFKTNDSIIINVSFPGCIVTPNQKLLTTNQDKIKATFFITPIAKTKSNGSVTISQDGEEIENISLDFKVVDMRTAKFLSIIGFLLAVFPSLWFTLFGKDLNTQIVSTLIYVLPTLTSPILLVIEIIGSGCLFLISIVFYLQYQSKRSHINRELY